MTRGECGLHAVDDGAQLEAELRGPAQGHSGTYVDGRLRQEATATAPHRMQDPAPWQTTARKKQVHAQEAARVAAEIRSAFHAGMAYVPSFGKAAPGSSPPFVVQNGRAASRWEHRKEEWGCTLCSTRNFITRNRCRECLRDRTPDCPIFPQGSRPPPHHDSSGTAPGGTEKGGQSPEGIKPTVPAASLGQTSDPILLAEAAVSAATHAGMSASVIKQLQEDVEARRRAVVEKQPLAKRLQQATVKATQAETACTKAEERLTNAQKAAAEARDALSAAGAEVDRLTAEIASSRPASAQRVDTRCVLADLLAAVKAQADGSPAGADQLAKATVAAQSALAPPQSGGSMEVDAQQRQAADSVAEAAQKATAEAAQKAAAEATTERTRAEAAARQEETRKRAEEALEAMESTDLGREEKRKRLEEVLSQHWGAAAAYAPTQLVT